ncbi:MAG: nucleotidyltransferase domain-containing protein [Methanosarcinales archaeon]
MLKFKASFYNLPKKVQNYILDSILKVEEISNIKVVSAVLFGSIVNQDFSKTSDVDLIIILEDIGDLKLRKIKRAMRKIECEYGLAHLAECNFLNWIKECTGMYSSNFICTRSDFISANFIKIFNTNRLLTILLAPTEIVLSNFILNAKTIYGNDLIPLFRKPSITKMQIFKSFIMNLLLSISAIVIYPITPDSTKYSMEAIKWSLHSVYHYSTSASSSTEKLIEEFSDKSYLLKTQLIQFKKLRNQYKKDFKFNLKTPIVVWRLHSQYLLKW